VLSCASYWGLVIFWFWVFRWFIRLGGFGFFDFKGASVVFLSVCLLDFNSVEFVWLKV
jgi:hypothetical protein